MAMRAFHINKDGVKTEVTGVITELTISGEYRSLQQELYIRRGAWIQRPAHMDYPDGGRRHIQSN